MTKKHIIAGMLLTAIATPLFASAQSSTSTPSFDVQCVDVAISKRDTALIAELTTYTSSITAAINTRTTALQQAFGLPKRSDRNAARQSAWDAYRTARKSAHTTATASHTATWNTYNTDMSACGVKTPVESTAAGSVL